MIRKICSKITSVVLAVETDVVLGLSVLAVPLLIDGNYKLTG